MTTVTRSGWPERVEAAAGDGSGRDAGAVRVLVVEDEVRQAAALKRGLEAEGYAVDVAANGTDGLWLATEQPYDVIVLDVMLPGMNGFKVCAELRARQIWTPVLMLTAKDGELDEAEALDTGADDFLSKPFSYVVLVARLRALLRRGARGPPGCAARRAASGWTSGPRCTVDGQPVELTPREFAVLEYLMRRPARSCRRRRSSTTCGTSRSTATRTSSRCTSRRCAASSAPGDRDGPRRRLPDRGAWRAEPALRVRARVTVGATIVLAAALVVAGALADALLRRALADDVDASLEHRLDQVRGLTVAGELTAVLVPTGRDLAQLQVVDSRATSSPRRLGWRPARASTSSRRRRPGTRCGRRSTASRFGGRAGEAYRLRLAPFGGARPSRCTRSRRSRRRSGRSRTSASGWRSGCRARAARRLVIWRVTGRALGPVDAMRAEVDRIQATDLARRVSPAGGGSEIDRLGATLNHMLDRLEGRRRPPAAVRGVGVARAAQPAVGDPHRARGRPRLPGARGLAEGRRRLVGRDRPPGGAGPRPARPDPPALGRRPAGATRPVGARRATRSAGGSPLAACGTTSTAPARGSPWTADVAQALRNLLDNAERHAATTIDVQLGRAEDVPPLTVANDGPAIPSDRRDAIFEPFTRLDEARSLD